VAPPSGDRLEFSKAYELHGGATPVIPWVRVDINLRHHPKGIKAGPLGRDLFVSGLQHCTEFRTDGFIAEDVVPHLAPGQPRPAAVVKRLVEAGLWSWDADRKGFVVHDYLDRNPSKDEIHARVEQRREAGRRGGIRSGEARQGRSKTPADTKRAASTSLAEQEAVASEATKKTGSNGQPHPHTPSHPEDRGDRVSPSRLPADPGSDPHPIRAILRSHAQHFERLKGEPFVLRWKVDAGKVKPILDVHGVAGTLRLQERFFASEDGWWVHKGDFTIGTFVSVANILVGSNGHAGLSPEARKALQSGEQFLEIMNRRRSP
jgi:hypothetical protein